MKAVADAIRHCWNLAPAEEAQAFPDDGPQSAPTPHDPFGFWSSSEEGDPPLPVRAGAAALPPSIRVGVNQSPVEPPSNSPTPPTGHTWDTVISEVMRKEAKLSLS